MDSLLPILQSQAAPMSLCSVCAKPGSCCSDFGLFASDGSLAATFWKTSWREDAADFLAERGLPYTPDRIASEHVADDGEIYVAVGYRCAHLLPNGLCGIYATRPDICRTFTPGTNKLCVMTDLSAAQGTDYE